MQHHGPADPDHDEGGDGSQRFAPWAVEGGDLGGVVVGVEVLAGHVGVGDRVLALTVVGRHQADAGQALGEVGEYVGQPVPHAQVAAVRCPLEPHRHREHAGHDQCEGDEGEAPAEDDQLHGEYDQRQGLHEQLHDSLLERLLEVLDVAGHAGHQASRPLLGEEVQRHALEVGKDPHTQAVDDVLVEPPGPQRAGVPDRDRDHDQHEVEGHDPEQERAVGVQGRPAQLVEPHAAVDGQLRDGGSHPSRHRLEDDEHEHAGHRPLERGEQAAQGERPAVVVELPELDDGLRVLGLVLEDALDERDHLVGQTGEGQARVGAGAGDPAAEAPEATRTAPEHQATPPSSEDTSRSVTPAAKKCAPSPTSSASGVSRRAAPSRTASSAGSATGPSSAVTMWWAWASCSTCSAFPSSASSRRASTRAYRGSVAMKLEVGAVGDDPATLEEHHPLRPG